MNPLSRRILQQTVTGRVDPFSFFSFVILWIVVLYACILGIFLKLRRFEIRKRLLDGSVTGDINDQRNFSFVFTTKVEDIYESSLGPRFSVTLFVIRVIWCIYFFSVAVVLQGILSFDTKYVTFANFNSILVFLYFLLSSICSYNGISTLRNRSALDIRLGYSNKTILCYNLNFTVGNLNGQITLKPLQYLLTYSLRSYSH